MKKLVILIAVAAVITALVVGCGSGPPPATAPIQATPGLPEFYLNPPVADDAVYGVGSARMASLDTSRRMAASRARDDIAFQMNATIQAAIIDYAQESGVDGQAQVINFAESISRQVTDVTLQGTRVEQVEQGPEGTVYALISYPMNNFTRATGEAFQRNEDAAWAEFKADQALQWLDAELQKNPPRSGSQN